MGFESPWYFFLIIALVPVIWLLRRSEGITTAVMLVCKSPPPSKIYFISRLILMTIFISSLVIVTADPYTQTGAANDYLLLVDTSRSMQARTSCNEPTFFDRARVVMSKILQAVPEGRFGIVAFDRLAFPVTQITYDHGYLNEVIYQSLSIGMAYQATTTDITNALSVIAQKKQTLPEIFGNVVHVFLISDGYIENTAWGDEISTSANELRETGLKVTTVGIGNAVDTPIPIINSSGICRDEFIRVNGEIVRIPLRTDILKTIASETQGKYFGERQIDGLIEYIRDKTLTEGTGNYVDNHHSKRESISWIFLLSATLALLGFLVLR